VPQETLIAYAHRPEPELPSSRSMKGAASELPTPPHRASPAPKPRTLPAFEGPPQVSPLLMARYDREDLYEKVWTLTDGSKDTNATLTLFDEAA
jgi:hypothetical protein